MGQINCKIGLNYYQVSLYAVELDFCVNILMGQRTQKSTFKNPRMMKTCRSFKISIVFSIEKLFTNSYIHIFSEFRKKQAKLLHNLNPLLLNHFYVNSSHRHCAQNEHHAIVTEISFFLIY